MTTVIDIGAQKIQHVGSSWSFGSNHYSSSQFPKVSIGITVNESPSTCLRQRNENDLRKSISCQSTAEDPKSGIEGPVERKMSYDVADKKASTPTWFSTRSVHADIPIYEAGKSYANKSKEVDVHTKNNILACDGRREKGESGKRTEEVKVQDNVNKGNSANEQGGTSIFKSSNFNNCAVASREEAAFPTKQEKDKKNEADTNCKNSALKAKLWEILGNTPSENRKNADCPVATQESNLGRSKLPSPEPYVNKDNVDAYQTNQFKKDRDSNEFKKNICGNGLKKDQNNNDAYQTNEFKKGNDSNEFRKVICGNGTKKDKKSHALQKDKNNSDFKKVNTSIEFKKSNADSSAKTRLQQLKGNVDLKRNLNGEFKKQKRPKNNKNSDTIEDDSESPSQDIKRPVTRSSTRKKASPKRLEKMKSIATKKNLSSSFKAGFKLESEKNNVFAFDEVEAKARGSDSSSGHSSRKSTEKNGEQNNNNHELPKVHLSKCYSAKSMQKNEKKLESESINKSSFEFMKKENASVKNQDNGKCSKLLDDSIPNSQKAVKQNFGIPLSNACSPLFQKNPHPWGQQDSPPVHKNVFLHQEYVPYSAMEKKNNRWADEHSPTFAAYTSPTSPIVLNSEDLSTPLTESIKRSKALHNSSSESSQPNTDVSPESCQPDSDAEYEQVKDDYQASHKAEDTESLLMNGNREKRNFTFSQMEEVKEDSESQDDDLSGKKHGLPSDFGLANKWSPSPERSHESSPISLPKAKKARRLCNVKSSTVMNHPTLPTSSTESEDIVGLHEGLKQFPEGGLGRCFAQLALALGRYKRRMKSKTDRKGLEIMSAAADNIKQQLQNFRSQMLNNMGEFTTASKSKRKHLESKLQEEQEMLKILHEKFREEVNQHLSNYKTVLDEIEAHNKELKVSADRQKASHRKLMQQVEEAIGAQLNSAEANIAAVQKDAQKKMNSLKRMLKAYGMGTSVEN